MHLAQAYDWQYGGWGQAPKFPQPMTLEFLLRCSIKGDQFAKDMALHTLDAMARGGMYDVIGGGFSRYSTDDNWLIPHFEKMLYDNAQLALVYLHAYLVSGKTFYRQICEETLDFVAREMKAPQGGFYSSLDADSEGGEGKFYVWTSAEICSVLELAQPSSSSLNWVEFFLAAYQIGETGNFEGHTTILQRQMDDKTLAEKFTLSLEQVTILLKQTHQALFQARSQRVRPSIDDKVLVVWNSLTMIAFAEAARYLQRSDYLDIARQNADFLLAEFYSKERLLRSWRNGQTRYNAYLEDYAGLILGLIALYQSDPDPWWFNSAQDLMNDVLANFCDPEYGFFDTRADHSPLLLRPKNLQDNATPSGNAMIAQGLLLLSSYTGNIQWRQIAERMLGGLQTTIARYPTAFAQWLCVLDSALQPLQEIAILGDLSAKNVQEMLKILWGRYRPHVLLAASKFPPESTAPALLKDRSLLDNLPTAYICQQFACQHPVNSSAEFAAQINQ